MLPNLPLFKLGDGRFNFCLITGLHKDVNVTVGYFKICQFVLTYLFNNNTVTF